MRGLQVEKLPARGGGVIFKTLVPLFAGFFLAVMVLLSPVFASEEAGMTQVIDAEGSAPIVGLDLARARNQAVRNALRQAVAQVANHLLNPEEAEQKSPLLKELIDSQAEGFIQDYRLVFETAVMDVYTVAIRVTVISGGIRNELLRRGLTRPDRPKTPSVRTSLTIRGIRSYGDYARWQGILKERIPGITSVFPREASWGTVRFDIAADGAIPTVAERLGERAQGEIRRMGDGSLEIYLK